MPWRAPAVLRAGDRQYLDAVVAGIGHVDVAGPVDRHAARKVELSGAAAAQPPLGDPFALGSQLLDPVVSRVRHVHVARSIDRAPIGGVHPTGTATERAPLSERLTRRGELLDAVVAGV